LHERAVRCILNRRKRSLQRVPTVAHKEITELKIRRILAAALALALCLALVAGCGKGNTSGDTVPNGDKESSDTPAPNGGGGNKDDSKKNDGKTDPAPSGKDDKKDDGKDDKKDDADKNDGSATPSDAPTVIVIPSATPGNADEQYTVEPNPFSDTAGEVTEIGGGVIKYKVMESKSGETLEDYALFDPADYKVTDRTAELSYDDGTPFYTRQDGNWYIASADDVSVGDTIFIVIVQKTGELEGVIIFSN
jgi:hypothetical protein